MDSIISHVQLYRQPELSTFAFHLLARPRTHCHDKRQQRATTIDEHVAFVRLDCVRGLMLSARSSMETHFHVTRCTAVNFAVVAGSFNNLPVRHSRQTASNIFCSQPKCFDGLQRCNGDYNSRRFVCDGKFAYISHAPVFACHPPVGLCGIATWRHAFSHHMHICTHSLCKSPAQSTLNGRVRASRKRSARIPTECSRNRTYILCVCVVPTAETGLPCTLPPCQSNLICC